MPDNLSLRDYFAGQALAGITRLGGTAGYFAELSYQIADVMLVERTKGVPVIKTLDQAIEILNRYKFLGVQTWERKGESALSDYLPLPESHRSLLPGYAAIATAQKLAEDNYGK